MNYTEESARTEGHLGPVRERLDDCRNLRLLHSSLGLSSDLRELAHSTDEINFVEELGDVLWFLTLGYRGLELNLPQGYRVQHDNTATQCLDVMQRLAAEYADCVKAKLFYGKHVVNVDGKRRDIQGVLRVQLNTILAMLVTLAGLKGYTQEQIQKANLAKLTARYPDRFTEGAATERNHAAERTAIADAVA